MTSTPEPLPFGSITDVEGVRVGHHQRVGRGWQTGTTVVFAPHGATPGVDVRGGGPGTRETDALEPHNLIEQIHAVCLTGGSAYGLAAADGVMAWLEERSPRLHRRPPGFRTRPRRPRRAGGGDLRSRPRRRLRASARRRLRPARHRRGAARPAPMGIGRRRYRRGCRRPAGRRRHRQHHRSSPPARR